MRRKYLFVAVFLFLAGRSGFAQSGQPLYKDPAFIDTVLQHHNAYRSALHLPALTWSADLASDALAWAKNLAKIDKGQHDSGVRGKEGENIWWGTTGAYSPGEMVNFWGNEKEGFVYGIFPDCKVSRSAVVGHYTQVVWKNTTSVGCALVSNGKMDYLVCRYSAPGNIVGEKPY
jgi:uncharacterized protein YkwD